MAIAELEPTQTENRTELADFLVQHLMEVEVEVSTGYSTSVKIDDDKMLGMVQAYEEKMRAVEPIQEDGENSNENVSGSVKLFNSKHPAVRLVNDAKRAITAYRDSMTMCLPELPALQVDEATVKRLSGKAPGKRLIFTAKLDEFTQHMLVLIENFKAAVRNLNEQLPDIIEFDRQRTSKRLFDEKAYPKEIIAEVRGPFPKEVNYSVNFERLAPATCQMIKSVVQRRMLDAVDITTNELAKNLGEFAYVLADQLSNRTRLIVPRNHVMYNELRDAEVLAVLPAEECPDLIGTDSPAELAVQVRKKVERAARGESNPKNEPVWYVFTRAEYEALRPETTKEKKILRESSLLNLRQQCETVKNIAAMLGDSGNALTDVVHKLEDALVETGSSVDEQIEELRNHSTARSSIRTALLDAAASLESIPAVDARRLNACKRRITVKGAA